ncbi:hypothetical protein AGMMS50249_5450 [candidate division SR1 bacterium]|nr:hypothetical protein AGMMS50249_5450 [candidate division SR1 bacterium]
MSYSRETNFSIELICKITIHTGCLTKILEEIKNEYHNKSGF